MAVLFSISPTAVEADGASTATATVTIVDWVTAQPIDGETVSFATEGDVEFSDGAMCTTATQGTRRGTCSVDITASTTPGVEDIVATSNGRSVTRALREFPAPATISVGLDRSTVLADGASTTAATAVVQDADGAPPNGALVTFSTDGDASFPARDHCFTDGAGTCSVDVRSSATPGVETITAAVGTATGSAALTESLQSAVDVELSPAAIPFVSPGALADGSGVVTSTATATVVDTAGNPLAGAPVAFGTDGDVMFANQPVHLEGTSVRFHELGKCTTGADGRCAVTIVPSTTGGVETVTATSGPATGAGRLDEYAEPVDDVSVGVSPASIVANASDTTSAAATVVDAAADPIEGAVVVFSTDGDVTFPGGDECITDATGTCSVAVGSSTTAGTHTITAAFGDAVGTGVVEETAGALASVDLSLAPDSLTADGADTSTATAAAADSFGNGVGGAVVSFSTDGDVSFSDGASCTTGSDGTCSVTVTSSTTPGSQTITATSGDFSDTATLAEVPGVVAALDVALDPATVTADGTSTATADVVATDAQGNAVEGSPVSFSTDGDVTFSDDGECTTGPDGTCSVTVTASTTSGEETVTAQSGDVSGAAVLTESVGTVADVTLTLDPETVKADGTAASTAAVTLKDANGNLVPAATVTFVTDGDVTFSDNGECTTGAEGSCLVTITASTTAGWETITAESGGVSDASVLAEIGPPAALDLKLDPDVLTADGASTSTATATATDAFGRPVADAVLGFSTDGDATFSDGGQCTTGAYGWCSVTVTASTTAGDETVTVTAGDAAGSATLTEEAGPLAAVAVELDPSSITADGQSTSTATAKAEDDFGNDVEGVAVSFSTDGDVTFSDDGECTTGAEGSCSVTVTASTTAGDETITATSGEFGGSAVLSEVAGAPASVEVALDPETVIADGAATSAATTVVTDVHGNPVAGEVVAFSTSGDVTFSDNGECTTAGAGSCAVTVTSSTTAGPETITAVAGTASGTATLTETAGPVEGVTLTLDPDSVTANGTDTSDATASLQDAHGNVVGGATVTFETDGDVTFSDDGECTTDSSGECSLTVTASTTAGEETITAESGAGTGSATLTENAGRATGVVLSLEPDELTADGVSTSTATAWRRDAHGNVVPGEAFFQFGTDGDVAIPDDGACMAGPSGVCALTITASTTAGPNTISVASGTRFASKLLTERPGPIRSVSVDLEPDVIDVISPWSVNPLAFLDGGDPFPTSVATVTVTDVNGNLIGGAPAAFSTGGDTTFPEGSSCTTGTSGAGFGKCSVVIRASTTPGEQQITASSGGRLGRATLTEVQPSGPGT